MLLSNKLVALIRNRPQSHMTFQVVVQSVARYRGAASAGTYLPRKNAKKSSEMQQIERNKEINPLETCSDNLPIQTNPYTQEAPKCVLCKFRVPLDYKNVRLLSQFVSTFSGRLYDKHITGLCAHQQERVRETIRRSRRAGYMPILIKEPQYLRDPKLFDPMKPSRHNPF